MGRYGMLKCNANYSQNKGNKDCRICGVIHDEDHRINHCVLYEGINCFDSNIKIDFNMVYSDDLESALNVVEIILKMWDLGNGRNEMRTL